MSGVISISANGRYLLRDGVPFRLQGDSPWEIFTELDSTELDTYLADRQSRGFNALITQPTNPVKYTVGAHSPGAKAVGDALPFLLNSSGGTWTGVFANHDAAFSSPNSTYFDWVDTVFTRCAARGMVVRASYNYLGFDFGIADGWYLDMVNAANTQAVCYAYGLYLGNRWKNHPNLIIDMGVDMFPVSGSEGSARQLKILDGLQDAGCTQLVDGHYKRSSDSLDYSDYNSRITFNGVYPSAGGSSYAPNYGRSRLAYARTPAKPCADIETKYEGEFSFTRSQIREQMWWGYLSCIGGYFFGNNPIWTFGTGWPAALSAVGTLDMQRMGAFLDSVQWNTLVPNGLDSIGTLITLGGGTTQTIGAPGTDDTNNGNDYIAAAVNRNGTLWIGYVPTAHSGAFRVDMTKMSGTITATWYDPTDASVQSIGSFPNTGTHDFTIPGNNSSGTSDWVLKLTSPTHGMPAIFGFWGS